MTRGHSTTVFGYRPFRAHSSGQTVINFVSGSLWMMPTCAGAENGFSAEPSADPEAEPLCSGAQHESVRSRLTPEPCNGLNTCLSSHLLNTCPSADPSAGNGFHGMPCVEHSVSKRGQQCELNLEPNLQISVEKQRFLGTPTNSKGKTTIPQKTH